MTVLTDRERAHFEAVRGVVLRELSDIWEDTNVRAVCLSSAIAHVVAPLLARVEALEERVNVLDGEYTPADALRNELSAAIAARDAMERSRDQLSAALRRTEEQRDTLDVDRLQLREKLALRDSEIAVLKVERDDALKKLDSARMRLDAAREDRDIVRTDLGKDVESAERTIAHLRQQLAEVTRLSRDRGAALHDAVHVISDLREAATTGALTSTDPAVERADVWLNGVNACAEHRSTDMLRELVNALPLDKLRELVNALPLDDGPRIAAIEKARAYLREIDGGV